METDKGPSLQAVTSSLKSLIGAVENLIAAGRRMAELQAELTERVKVLESQTLASE